MRRRAIFCAVVVAVLTALVLPFSTSAFTPIKLDTPYTYVNGFNLPFDPEANGYEANVQAFINNVSLEEELNGTGAVFDVTASSFSIMVGAFDYNDNFVALVGKLSAIAYVPGYTQFPTLITDVDVMFVFLGGQNEASTRKVSIVVDTGEQSNLWFTYEMPENLTLTITEYDKSTEDALYDMLQAFSVQGDITAGDYAKYIIGGYMDICGAFTSSLTQDGSSLNMVFALSIIMLGAFIAMVCLRFIFQLFRNGG